VRHARPGEDRLRRRKRLERVAIVLVTASAILLFVLGIDRALQPTLGPDEVPDREPWTWSSPRPLHLVSSGPCGGDLAAPYDVNRALLSDEPTDPDLEPEPEGEGPARRRYVPAERGDEWVRVAFYPVGRWRDRVIEGKTSLVSRYSYGYELRPPLLSRHATLVSLRDR
jgi:hypothetical protein